MTLAEYLAESSENSALNSILTDFAEGGKKVAALVARAGLIDILGAVGSENVQGEEQQKLDVLADDIFTDLMLANPAVAAVASEEKDHADIFEGKNGDFVVAFDPLDGSSNIDVNVSIGTIFSIFKKKNETVEESDFYQKGDDLVASGYVLYGTSTNMVFTTGNGTHGFTFDPLDSNYKYSHKNMMFKDGAKIYSMNEGNIAQSNKLVKDFVQWCQESDKATKRPFSGRYLGSLVADFHRNLLKGGIYMYPATHNVPNGKLRLLYECAPLAFIAEQSGGMATNGEIRVMEIVPTELHQRVPYYVGNTELVERVTSKFHTGEV